MTNESLKFKHLSPKTLIILGKNEENQLYKELTIDLLSTKKHALMTFNKPKTFQTFIILG